MPAVKSFVMTPARLAANRRNALKSTGPRTRAGKHRASLNGRTQGLCPQQLERELRARGEDLGEFRRLHRDLIAIFRPQDVAAIGVVEGLARTWWEKARRIRHWVAAGPPLTKDLDTRLEELLLFLVHVLRQRHEWWRHRLISVLGQSLQSPEDVRRQIESRLFIFGARRGKRKYPREAPREEQLKEFAEALGRILAGETAGPAAEALAQILATRPAKGPEPQAHEVSEANRRQGS